MPISQEISTKLGRYLTMATELIKGIKGDRGRPDASPPLQGREELVELAGAKVNTITWPKRRGATPRSRSQKPSPSRCNTGSVLVMQEYFGTRPWRQPNETAVVMSFTNFKAAAGNHDILACGILLRQSWLSRLFVDPIPAIADL